MFQDKLIIIKLLIILFRPKPSSSVVFKSLDLDIGFVLPSISGQGRKLVVNQSFALRKKINCLLHHRKIIVSWQVISQ